MISAEEVLRHIELGESGTLEFKEDAVRNEHLAKELGALANFRGGMLLLGVSDTGELIGLTRDDNEERLQNIAYNFEPPIPLQVEKITIREKALISVSIEDISGKPYVYKSSTRNIYYTRAGSVSREATRAEVRRMFQESVELHYEVAPVPRSDIRDLNLFLLDNYLTDYRNISLDQLEKDEQITLLQNLSLLTPSGTATVLGIILFGKAPSLFLAGTAIQVVIYDGTTKIDAVHDHKIFSQALVADLPGLIAFVNQYNPHSFDNSSGQRIEKMQYPDFAIREAIVNAVCHRDLTLQGQLISIEIYSDRIEIISPGGLPNTQTIERMKTGLSYARNPLLLQYLYDYRYVERLGRGVPKILTAMVNNGNPPAKLIDLGTRFSVILPARIQWVSPEAGKPSDAVEH